MITKADFLLKWHFGDCFTKWMLSDNIAVSADWDSSKSDPGCAMFLGTLAEELAKAYLDENAMSYQWSPDNNYVLFKSDDRLPIVNKCDLRLSRRAGGWANVEIKCTKKDCIPDYLEAKAKKEGAEGMFVVTGLTTEGYPFGALKLRDSCCLQFVNFNTKATVKLWDYKKCAETISKILKFDENLL